MRSQDETTMSKGYLRHLARQLPLDHEITQLTMYADCAQFTTAHQESLFVPDRKRTRKEQHNEYARFA